MQTPIPVETTADGVTLMGSDALALIEQSQSAHFVIQDELIVYANPMFAALIGWPRGELIGRHHQVATPPAHLERTREIVARRLAGKAGRPGQMPMVRRDGSHFDVRIFATLTTFGERPAVLVTLHDITELNGALQRASWNAQMLQRTEALCRSGSFEIALPQGVVKLSSGLQRLLGLADDACACSVDALDWVPPNERDLVAGIWRGAEPGEAFDFQHRVLTARGQRLTVLHRGCVEQDEAGRRRGIALLQDITAQREAEQRMQQLATQDDVTGLPNRAAFLDKVDAAIVAAGWDEHVVTLLAIDVPRISELSDTLGFGAGDALAMALAARLQQAAGEGEVVARLGSHEFALMLGLPTDAAKAQSIVLARAERMRQVLEAPVRVFTTETFARCIIGVASFPADAQRPAELLELAQTARLRATQDGRVVLYEPASNARALREMHVEALLRQAIADNELELHYQPQVALSDGRVAGAQALLRWISPALGVVAPDEFIPIAERAGLIPALGDWVLRRACQQIARWRTESVAPVRISINLWAMHLQRRDLAQHVQAVLFETGAAPALLGIEVSEGSVMANLETAAAMLREIKALGVEVSLDDFGSGYSSLGCLRSLPIDVVKMDPMFVHDVTAAPADVSVTRAIVTMAHGLQLKVLAEGVESEGQLSLLAANRCDLIQGRVFSAALQADAFAALLREGNRLPARFVTRVRNTRTLLLVDDDANILASLKRLLRRDGYTIVTAASAAEGLQRLADCEVDVIVSDQRMPAMTGVEFLRRAKDLYPHTIRMVLSGYTELQSIIDAVNEGAIYKFLTKPWDDGLLRGHLAEAFRQKELADENRRLARQVEAASASYQALNQRLEALLAQQRGEAELLAVVASSARDALEALPAAVVVVDGDGTLAFVNAGARELIPGAAAELGAPAVDVLPACMTLANWDADEVAPILEFGGRRHRALRHTLQRDGQMPSHILLLTPEIGAKAH